MNADEPCMAGGWPRIVQNNADGKQKDVGAYLRYAFIGGF